MANTYCALTDMQDILSSVGVTLRIDDSPPTTYGKAIAKAGNTIDRYLYRRYASSDLATSSLVTDLAASLAVNYLCRRRGNPVPPGVAEIYAETIAYLEEVQAGVNDIPEIAPRKAYAPGLSVLVATQRPFPRAVVERSRNPVLGGVAANYSPKNNSPLDTYGWNAQSFLNFSW